MKFKVTFPCTSFTSVECQQKENIARFRYVYVCAFFTSDIIDMQTYMDIFYCPLRKAVFIIIGLFFYACEALGLFRCFSPFVGFGGCRTLDSGEC